MSKIFFVRIVTDSRFTRSSSINDSWRMIVNEIVNRILYALRYATNARTRPCGVWCNLKHSNSSLFCAPDTSGAQKRVVVFA